MNCPLLLVPLFFVLLQPTLSSNLDLHPSTVHHTAVSAQSDNRYAPVRQGPDLVSETYSPQDQLVPPRTRRNVQEQELARTRARMQEQQGFLQQRLIFSSDFLTSWSTPVSSEVVPSSGGGAFSAELGVAPSSGDDVTSNGGGGLFVGEDGTSSNDHFPLLISGEQVEKPSICCSCCNKTCCKRTTLRTGVCLTLCGIVLGATYTHNRAYYQSKYAIASPDAAFRHKGVLCADLSRSNDAYALLRFSSRENAMQFVLSASKEALLDGLHRFARGGDARLAISNKGNRAPAVLGDSATEVGNWSGLKFLDLLKSEEKRATVDGPWAGFFEGQRCGAKHAFLGGGISEQNMSGRLESSSSRSGNGIRIEKSPSAVVVAIGNISGGRVSCSNCSGGYWRRIALRGRDTGSAEDGPLNAICRCTKLPGKYGSASEFPACLRACTKVVLDVLAGRDIPAGVALVSGADPTEVFEELLERKGVRNEVKLKYSVGEDFFCSGQHSTHVFFTVAWS